MSDDARYLYIGSWIGLVLLYLLGRLSLHPLAFSVEHPLSLAAFALLNLLFAALLRSLRKTTRSAVETAMNTDPASGLYNSHHFFPTVETEIDRSKRKQHAFCLVYMDIDYFHRYNQTDGIKAGDAVIAHLGEMLAGMTRRYDVGFRFGNDEFALVLPETDRVQARFIAERVNDAFQRAYEGKLSLSMGIAEWTAGDTVDALLRKAEAAMNESRRAGGNLIRAFVDRGGL